MYDYTSRNIKFCGDHVVKTFETAELFQRELGVYKKGLSITPKLLDVNEQEKSLTIERIDGLAIGHMESPDFSRLARLFGVLHNSTQDGELVFCHYETGLGNYLYSSVRDRYYMIDFSDSEMAYREDDIAHFLTYWSFLYDKARFAQTAAGFLAGYQQTDRLSLERYRQIVEDNFKFFDLPRWKFGKREMQSNKDIPENRALLTHLLDDCKIQVI